MKGLFQFLLELWTVIGRYKRLLPFLIALFLLSTIIELIGLGMVGWYAGMLIDPEMMGTGLIDRFFLYTGLTLPDIDPLILVGTTLVAIFVLRAAFTVGVNYSIILFTGKIGVDLKTRLVTAYINQPYIDYVRRSNAEFIEAVKSFTRQVCSSATELLRLCSDAIMASGLLIYLGITNWKALAVLSVLLGLSIIIYDKIYRVRLTVYGKSINELGIVITRALTEGLHGLKEVRILGKGQYFIREVQTNETKSLNYQIKAKLINLVPEIMLQLILIVFLVIMVSWAVLIEENTKAVLPMAGIFALAGIRLVPASIRLARTASQLRAQRHSLNHVYKDLHRHEQIEARENTYVCPVPHGTRFTGLTLENISFRYPGTEKNILSNVSLEIQSGQSIGLMGTSGSGKTTLIDVILGLLTPNEGQIYCNGYAFPEILEFWQSKVAYIPQEIFLSNTTLQQNVALGENPELVDQERVLDSIRRARLGQTITDLKRGLNTLVGERGLRLSGGQRQRIALARALYHEREVLVMDEATSALDQNTEMEIVNEIKTLKGLHTLIVISHRQTTLEHCDFIYEISNGELTLT